jgi:diguanylate cyclase (GGDEF)-like protein
LPETKAFVLIRTPAWEATSKKGPDALPFSRPRPVAQGAIGSPLKTLNTRSRIILLVVAAAMPALAFTIYSSWDERERAEAHARQELQQLAKLAAQRQEQVIKAAEQTLEAIALVPTSVLFDQPRCNEYLAKLLRKSLEIYQSLGIYDTNNVLICNAVPWQDRVVSPDRLYIQLAGSSGRMAIGEYQVGRVTKQQGFNIGYPIRGTTGKVTGVAFVGINLDRLNRMAATTPLPPQSVLTVVDRNGVVLIRHPALAERIGQKLQNPQVTRVVLSGRSGIFQMKATDGSERLWAYETIADNPDGVIALRILVSTPLKAIFAEADRSFIRNLLGIVLATGLLLLAAWFGTEILVLRNLRKLSDTARRVHAGDLTARTGLRSGDEEISQLGSVFDEMAQALQDRDAKLQQALRESHELAVTDPLTGLYNRRYLWDLLGRDLLKARRNRTPVAAILADIDHFKRFNDTWGHEAGDLVLKRVADVLRKNVRGSDIACRYGGEELAAILPEATLEVAIERAENIRRDIATMRLDYRGRPLDTVTASFGVAVLPEHASDAEALLRAADHALYDAKKAGRNRVVVSSAKAVVVETALQGRP